MDTWVKDWIYEKQGEHYEIKSNILIVVEWHDIVGNYHSDYFCTSAIKYNLWGNGDNGSTHVWANPSQGVRQFLSHIPLHDVKISIREE